ncbi:MAG: AAA family ATPase, partial [Thermodesulfobacteriota bacterium]|nr:AAA family ATPase [Thermodesulfobacteriota bacterium]
MAGIYVGSTSGFSGKNMVVMGLGLKFQKDGLSVGYMKPVGAMPKEIDGRLWDEDAYFVQDVLGLNEEPDLVTPVLVTHDFKVNAFSGKCENLMSGIEDALDDVVNITFEYCVFDTYFKRILIALNQTNIHYREKITSQK